MSQIQGTFDGFAVIENKRIVKCSKKIEAVIDDMGIDWIADWDECQLPLCIKLNIDRQITVEFLEKGKYLAIFEDLKKVRLLTETNRDLKFIFTNSFDGIYVTDGNGLTVSLNPAIERNFGLSSSEMIGKNVKELECEGVFNPSVVLKVLQKKKRVTAYQNTKIGKRLMATGNPIFNEDGEIIRVVCNSTDITEIYQLRELLKEKEEKVRVYENELLLLRQRATNLAGFIFSSAKMQNVFSRVQRISTVDSNVLITGESGTGKEVVARAIHALSSRSKGSFIKVNSSAIPETLLESELFGYDPGAFTGAQKNGKPGYFELANNGTLFLDEIGEVPLLIQPKLLEAIQDKSIKRIGGTKTIELDFRLIAATNRDLKKMVEQGTFREDLFYRLNVLPIELPPLKERSEDISLLIHHFLTKFNTKHNLNRQFTSEAIRMLSNYEWPGNIRELQNLIERLVVLAEDVQIREQDIMAMLPNLAPGPSLAAIGKEDKMLVKVKFVGNEIISLPETLKSVEKELIYEALHKFSSTRKAARQLKISQSSLMRRLKTHNVPEIEL
ncbi:sigma 54-interacting transcriptional regulator [Desulfosporosinus sp. PR]|uniref:sigma-54 interaction domain-containing protein n=1 Tax=Candidatus Desulfosporosinus nitrosoreducens TaxID=3401928 RepID=UPI0027F154BC|nr:sigma 54-interacting transcriptional regulator [Desulfosporosinus sp. PR]MDQ7094141.1 sigma 54-interacting transcriptional regulator [Desulfosporosinus sp. PR]